MKKWRKNIRKLIKNSGKEKDDVVELHRVVNLYKAYGNEKTVLTKGDKFEVKKREQV